MNFWGYWVNDSQGFEALGNNATGKLLVGNSTRNLWGVGLRPVFWIADNLAIQGQAGMNYIDTNRGYTNGKFFGTNTFGRAGTIGIFTICPTIKPKGGYFTRPEIRLFATYAIWSRSVRGATTPIGEGGNTGPSAPPYNGNTNQGWLLGSQVEIWF